MKIALIGYGKMGRMVEKAAEQHGHRIVARINDSKWDESDLHEADVAIEFSQPDVAIQNIKKLASLKKQVVVGTTGWYDDLDAVRGLVLEADIGLIYSANFSIGINLTLMLIKEASKLMNSFQEYDVAGIEEHHNQKKDAPSGTAFEIARVVEGNMNRIERLPMSSVRCGSIPGTHTLLFDSPCDTISITHTARDRSGFAEGAIQAAEWLGARKGFYTFLECMQSIIEGKKP